MNIEGSAEPTPEGGPSALLPRLEQVLKFATAALGLVAAIGLPAVAIHLIRFGAPTSVAAYHDVIHAGILPALMLVGIALYCVAAGRALTRMSLRQFLGFHSLILLPVLFAAYVVLAVGVIAYALLALWGILWMVRFALVWVIGASISNRQMLVASAVLLGLIVAGVVAARILIRLRPNSRPAALLARWLDVSPPRSAAASPPATTPTAEAASPTAPAAPERPTKSDSKWDWLLGLIFIPMSFLMVYCIKGILHIWDPGLGSALTHRYVWAAATAVGVVLGLFIAGIFLAVSTTTPAPHATPRQRRAIVAGAAVAYLVFEAVYSWWGYPRLHPGWGGGRPEPVTLWLKREDVAEDITTLLRGARITDAGSLRRVDQVFVLLDSDKDLLLTDTRYGPARSLLVSKGRLMAISW